MGRISKSSVSEADYTVGEPWGIDTRVHMTRDGASDGGLLQVGIAELGVGSGTYTFTGDETLYVLEGEATIALEDGEQVDLHEGDLASFPNAETSRWTVRRPSRMLFVISD